MTIVDRELIDRYLAGRLSDPELEDVEARIVGDAAFRAEVDLTASMRAGLRALEARGELASVERLGRPLWRRPAYALAASVVAGVLGIATFALYAQLERTRAALVGLEVERVRGRPGAAATTRVVGVMRTRNAAGADVLLSAADPPALLELQLDPGPVPVDQYSVTLARAEGAVMATLINVPRATANGNGVVVLNVHSALLSPGEYRVTLTPLVEGAAAIEYRVRVAR